MVDTFSINSIERKVSERAGIGVTGVALDILHFLLYGFGDLLDGVMARAPRIQYEER